MDLSGKMEWIDCNRDIFREAIWIRHVDLTLKKKKRRRRNDDKNPPWFRFKYNRAEQHVVAVFHGTRFCAALVETNTDTELITRAYWCIQSLKFRRFYDEHRNEFARNVLPPLRSSYHSRAFPCRSINHRKMMFQSQFCTSTANLAYILLFCSFIGATVS